ncbi:MAG: hypothetical protein ABIJ45_14245 [Candidatus Zixiibacteriota bacterium]
MRNRITINVIYTNIGRGHPYYLDGIVDELKSDYSKQINLQITDVFKISKGLSYLLWKIVDFAYKFGSQGGIIGQLYSFLRQKRNPQKKGLIEKILGRHIRKYIQSNRYPTIIAHPILVPMIADLTDIYYQHGEIAVPPEALVIGARKIYIPIDYSLKSYDKYLAYKNICQLSGLCLPKIIIQEAQANYRLRISRLERGEKPIGAFFSSGAEPIDHLKKIIRTVNSLKNSGYKSILIYKKDGTSAKMVKKYFGSSYLSSLPNLTNNLKDQNIITLTFSNRNDLSEIEAALMPHIDYFVAPSHERTNWAVGLGLPMFILHPIIGTFSPLNRKFLLDNGVAIDIDSDKKADRFADILARCVKDKIMISMAQNGWNKYDLNGFMTIAKSLYNGIRIHSIHE